MKNADRQYRPDMSVRYSPRVPRRLRKAVNAICRASEMPESDVLRYGFEAAVLTATTRLKRSTASSAGPLDSMITLRTSRKIQRCVDEIWMKHPNTLKADVLRALLDSILRVARTRGMAYVMKLREDAINDR
jgi:hypothetical protein